MSQTAPPTASDPPITVTRSTPSPASASAAAGSEASAYRRSRHLDVAAAEPILSVGQERAIRVINIILAATAIVILLPLMLLIAIAIKLTSRGPILYTQIRVGVDRRAFVDDRRVQRERRLAARPRRNRDPGATAERRDSSRRSLRAPALRGRRHQDVGGSTFRIYKFRSMCVGAECGSGAVWAARNDGRVTPLGRVLRQLRLDELPQLFNVLLGDMNIVGPRPERPSIVCRLREQIPEYPLRLRARPGITGWAQIRQRYDACLEDVKRKVKLDLEYLGRRTVWRDLKIMIMTIPVMVFRRGGW